MDEIELTELFVSYSKAMKVMAELKTKIEAAVLERGETVKIAGVTATYYKPSFETPDYESAACAVIPEDFDYSPFSTVTTSIRWKEICESVGVVAPAGKEKPARVVVK
jgi:hypothetical protein